MNEMNLKQLREGIGFKQYKVAELLGITRQQLTNIESGKANLNSEKIEKLAGKFNIEPILILKAWEESKKCQKKRLNIIRNLKPY